MQKPLLERLFPFWIDRFVCLLYSVRYACIFTLILNLELCAVASSLWLAEIDCLELWLSPRVDLRFLIVVLMGSLCFFIAHCHIRLLTFDLPFCDESTTET